jgi:hypothetical protein
VSEVKKVPTLELAPPPTGDAQGRLVDAAEAVYQNRHLVFSDPYKIFRLIKALGRALNEVHGWK